MRTQHRQHQPEQYPTMHEETINRLAFVFWDENYDEVLAVTYTAKLRQAGIATKIVSLYGKQAFGQCGLLLTADYTLGEALALAQHAVCVVAPCHSPLVGRLDTDPRVRIFLDRAAANEAQFITGQISGRDLEIFPVAGHRVRAVVAEPTMITQAHQLGSLLTQQEHKI